MDKIERNLGIQPLARLMAEHQLKSHDLVAASDVQLTHKMVGRAAKGRRLTGNSKQKILDAFNKASGKNYQLSDLFNY